jgi:hypothetical protein
MTERMVHFFEEAGAENTDHVIKAVKQRIRQGGVDKVLVASESGRLALKVREEVPLLVSVICVTYNRQTRTRYQKPSLMKQRLQKAGVAIVDTVREPMGRRLVFRNWWERKTLQLPGTHSDLFWMTLICVGGHGLRTAVEIVFMAVESGTVKIGERVIALAGTGRGADSAIVVQGSRFDDAVGEDQGRRFKIEEILAMPKRTTWTGYG